MTKSSIAELGNIGPAGRRQRAVFGAVALVMAGALTVGLVEADAGGLWRLLVFPVWWFGLVGLLQARARTCIAFAARGTCEREAGVPEMNAERDALFRHRAKRIAGLATVLAALLTLGGVLMK